ncbi:hypothetical protein QYM36_011274 [Artemia franciscana]|uniref:Uncharacterized protein n=1 Tax=Artemia franciscana TaxID=6661 RepID=A0AA88L4M3_ARTSF|nr:hypothetical protein QYM36_011274 [Artemia franciscana]
MRCIFVLTVVLSSSVAYKDTSETLKTIKGEESILEASAREEQDEKMLDYFSPMYPRYYPTPYPYYQAPTFRFERPYSYVSPFLHYQYISRPNNLQRRRQPMKKKMTSEQSEITSRAATKGRFLFIIPIFTSQGTVGNAGSSNSGENTFILAPESSGSFGNTGSNFILVPNPLL